MRMTGAVQTGLIGLALLCSAHALAATPAAKVVAGKPWKMRIPAHAHVAQTGVANVQFEFACTTGKGGAIWIAAILPEPEALTAFALDPFEGPDGIGETKPLATWSIRGSRPTTAQVTISGWRGVDGDGFLLATTRDSVKESDLARLVKRWLDAGNESLRLVVDPPEQGDALEIEAEPGDRRAAIAKVLAPCLAKVK
jgi:hypothetical protein